MTSLYDEIAKQSEMTMDAWSGFVCRRLPGIDETVKALAAALSGAELLRRGVVSVRCSGRDGIDLMAVVRVVPPEASTADLRAAFGLEEG